VKAIPIFLLMLAIPSSAQSAPDLTLHPGETCCESRTLLSTTGAQSNPDSAVEKQLDSFIPRPYLLFGPALGGGGYRPVALLFEAGINVESRHFVMNAEAAYDNDRKTNDADQPNPNGHDRYLQGTIGFRPPSFPRALRFLGEPSHWYIGAGYRWSQLSTTNYVKGSNRPQFGGAYDLVLRSCSICRRDFSMRVAVNYFTAGNDWQNGSHGVEVDAIFPTPREDRHWFWRQRVEAYHFHGTVTDPTNIPLAQEERSQGGMDSAADFGLMYRF